MMASYPIVVVAIKLLVITLCNTRLIHSNHVYFFARLHQAAAQLLWAIAVFCRPSQAP